MIKWLEYYGIAYTTYYFVTGTVLIILFFVFTFSYWWHNELRYRYRWSDPRLKKPKPDQTITLFKRRE